MRCALVFLAGALLGAYAERTWIMRRRDELHTAWHRAINRLNGRGK